MDQDQNRNQDQQHDMPGQGSEHGSEQTHSQARLAESWQEIGRQVSELFEKISAAFRVAWTEERHGSTAAQEEARGLQADLRAAADRVERVMKRVATETEQERGATLEATRGVSERTVSEARTAAISGLKSLNQQLDQLVKRLDQQPGERTAPPTEPPPPSQDVEGQMQQPPTSTTGTPGTSE
jgi:hypothetical protein